MTIKQPNSPPPKTHIATEIGTQGPNTLIPLTLMAYELGTQATQMGDAPQTQSSINPDGIVDDIFEEINATHNKEIEWENVKEASQAPVSSTHSQNLI